MSGVYACVSDRRRLTGLSVWDCNNHSAYFSCSTQACQLPDPYWRQETYYTSAAQKHLFDCNFTAWLCVLTCVCVCVTAAVYAAYVLLYMMVYGKASLILMKSTNCLHVNVIICPRLAFMTAVLKWHELNMFSKY